MIKTNLINGARLGFNNCDIEYVLGRRFSLNVSYQTFTYGRSETGVKVRTGTIEPGGRNRDYKEFSILKNGETTGWIAGIGGKFYFDKIIPAPWGFYTDVNVGIGSANFSDYSVSHEYKEGLGNFDGEIYPQPDVSGLSGEAKIIFFEVPSLGFQKIFKRIIVVDAKVSFQGQYVALPEEMLNAFPHNYFTRSNTVTYAYDKLAMGLGVYVKIGILVF